MNEKLKHVSLLLLAFTLSFTVPVVDYGNWFDYVLDMEKEMKRGDYDIHLIYFEDLKEVGLSRVYSDRQLNSDSDLVCFIFQILE